MAPKRPSPLEDPPAASTSEEEEVEEDGDEEEEEDEEDEDEEEGDDDKSSSGKKPVQTPVTRSVPKSASSDDEESGTESGSDSEPSPEKFAQPSRIDPNIKPISSKPMDDGTKSKKPQANPSTPSAPQAKSTVPVKRPIETDKDDNSKKKKKKSVDEEDDAGISEDTEKKPGDDKKKQLFQRLWTEDDELAVLKGMLDYYSKKGTDPVADMNTFHDFIKKSLHFDVSRNQLYDKIRRMKKKYMNNTARAREGEDPHFSKPHEHKSFELSKKIWGSDDAINDHSASNGNLGMSRASKIAAGSPQSKASQILSDVSKGAAKSEVSKGSVKSEVSKGAAKSEVSKGAVKEEEEIDWSMYPYLFESFQSHKEASSMPRMGDSFVKEGFRLLSSSQLNELEKKWRELRREEIDLFFKRMELMGEQTKLFQEAYNRKK